MIKKITMLIFLILCSAAISLGQIVSLENLAVSPNSTTSVMVSVASVSNINSLTLKIGFSADQLDFIGISNQGLPGMTANVSNGNTINIVWTSTVAATPPATLCNLNFYYKGGNSELSFLPGCEFTQGANQLIVGYLNGGISPAPCLPTDGVATLGTAQCASGTPFFIPVSLSNLPLVGSFTLNIAYDAEKFVFAAITGGGALAGASAGASNGIVTIVWTANSLFPNGQNINTGGANSLNLHFSCLMPGSSVVSFAPGSVFTSGGSGVNVLPVCFNNGSISQVATTNFAEIDTLTGVSQGDLVQLPLILNFTEPVTDFTLSINFNSPVLAYTGIEVVNPLSSNVYLIAQVTGNVLNLVYTNPTPATFTGTFLKLKFQYHGMGEGFVGFDGFNEFGHLGLPVNVAFTDGYVAPGFNPGNASAEIGSVTANVNSIFEVPVTLDGGPVNLIGAATMFIGFDNAKLNFIGAVDQLSGTTVENLGNQISIAWANTSGMIFNNSTFIKLKFKYVGGGGNSCGSDIYFTNDIISSQSCELANEFAAIVPANWLNGGINLFPVNPTITGQANPVAGSTIGYSTESGMMNYSWVVSSGGSIVSANGSPSISVLWTAAGPGTVTVNYHNLGGCYLSTDKMVNVLSGGVTTDLEGYVTYDNSVNQGMNNVNITLYNSLGGIVGVPVTTYTNGTHGYYQFPGVPQDFYTMSVNTNAPWAGAPYVSGLDALLVELHTAGIYPLTGIKLMAANVNGGPTVNATDALLIKKRIIGEISTFPVGDWVFDNDVISCFTSPVSSYNFKGICSGDVNGSYNPVVGVKESIHIEILDQVIQTEQLNTAFDYSIKAGDNSNLGAVTLFLNYDPTAISVKSISSAFNGMEYSIQNGKIILVWSNPEGIQISENDELVNFELIMKNGFEQPATPFKLGSGCEFANPMASVINDSRLKMSRLTQNTGSLSFAVMPNPISNRATLNFVLPADGMVRIELADLCGSRIQQLTDSYFSSGSHSINLDVNTLNLTSGIYFATLRYSSDGEQSSKVIKLIVKK